jgi:Domain of unknown function (DUF4386)
MSTVVLMEPIVKVSPRLKARIAGALYLLSVLTAAFTELLARGRWNIAGGLIAVAIMVVVTLLLYEIFKPVNRGLSLLAAFFGLVGLGFEAFRWQPQGVNIAIVLAGFYCLLIGYLIFRSTFLPRILGGLMVIAGLGWLTYLSNPLVNYLSPYNLASALLAEASVFLWLLVMGVNIPKRKKKQELGELTEPSQRLVSAIPLTDGHQEKVDQQPPSGYAGRGVTVKKQAVALTTRRLLSDSGRITGKPYLTD